MYNHQPLRFVLGFVNGRSCAHKSKPRGLILCFYDFGCKGSTIFLQKRVVFILLFVNFCYRAYKKNAPDKIECKITAFFRDISNTFFLFYFLSLIKREYYGQEILFEQAFQIKREELLNGDGFATNNQFNIRMELFAELTHTFVVFPSTALDFNSH